MTGHDFSKFADDLEAMTSALGGAEWQLSDVPRQRDKAILDIERHSSETAKSIDQLTAQVKLLSSALDNERELRRAADEDTMRYTKKNNARNLVLQIAAVIIAAVSLAVTFYELGQRNAVKNHMDYSADAEAQSETR